MLRIRPILNRSRTKNAYENSTCFHRRPHAIQDSYGFHTCSILQTQYTVHDEVRRWNDGGTMVERWWHVMSCKRAASFDPYMCTCTHFTHTASICLITFEFGFVSQQMFVFQYAITYIIVSSNKHVWMGHGFESVTC